MGAGLRAHAPHLDSSKPELVLGIARGSRIEFIARVRVVDRARSVATHGLAGTNRPIAHHSFPQGPRPSRFPRRTQHKACVHAATPRIDA
jgi:hypothetical protein